MARVDPISAALLAVVVAAACDAEEPQSATPVATAPAEASQGHSPDTTAPPPVEASSASSPISALGHYCRALEEVRGESRPAAELVAEAQARAVARMGTDTPGLQFMLSLAFASPTERIERVEAELIQRGQTESCQLGMAELRAKAEGEALRHAPPRQSVAVAGFRFVVPTTWRPWTRGAYSDEAGERGVVLSSLVRTALRPTGTVLLRPVPTPAPECGWLIGEFTRKHGLPTAAGDDPCHYAADVGEHRRVEIAVLESRVLVVCDGDREEVARVCPGLMATRAEAAPAPAVNYGRLRIRGPAAAQHVEFAKVIAQHGAEIESCHAGTVGAHPQLEGALELSFVVSANGSVAVATVPTVADEAVTAFGHCIVGRAKRWTFPKPKGGNAVVKAPFAY